MTENITQWTIPSHCQQIRLCYKENTNAPLHFYCLHDVWTLQIVIQNQDVLPNKAAYCTIC
jgi:hypothetical protein